MTLHFDPNGRTAVPDWRFRDLLGPADWDRLPRAVRRRFSQHMTESASTVYQGAVTTMRMNPFGRALAFAARLIGSPLPYDRGSVGQPAVVTVTQDVAGHGQFWVRHYGRRAGFPQVVHSSKRFAGPTGLEEYVGCGIGMALILRRQETSLLFVARHYFIQIFGRRIRIPRWLSPGHLVIGHHDLGAGRFRFSLDLTHRFLGRMIHQDAVFQDPKG
ncbi:MAG: DUF4166 domain-containing protein [Pseudomonadota bacterium]